AFAFLPPSSSTVSLTMRLPNCLASRVVRVQVSILRPRTAPPVSATRYSPLQLPASNGTRVPGGNTHGSAATKPRDPAPPLAVRPRRLYAVAVEAWPGTLKTAAAIGFTVDGIGAAFGFASVASPVGAVASLAASAKAELASELAG